MTKISHTNFFNELVDQPSLEIEESETWSEQNQNGLLTFALQYVTTAFSNAEEIET